MSKDNLLTDGELEALRALADEHGEDGAARILGIHRHTLMRGLAGRHLSNAVAMLVRGTLAGLRGVKQ